MRHIALMFAAALLQLLLAQGTDSADDPAWVKAIIKGLDQSRWETYWYVEGNQAHVESIDKSRVGRVTASTFSIWIRSDYATPLDLYPPTGQWDRSVEKREIDCSEMTWRPLGGSLYIGQKHVGTITPVAKSVQAEPESTAEKKLLLECRLSKQFAK